MKDLDYYKNLNIFNNQQLMIIKHGLRDNLDVTIYAKEEYSATKMLFLYRCLIYKYDYNYIIHIEDDNLIRNICDMLYKHRHSSKEKLEQKINLLILER